MKKKLMITAANIRSLGIFSIIAILTIILNSCTKSDKYFSDSLKIYKYDDTEYTKDIKGELVIKEVLGAYALNIIDSTICMPLGDMDFMFALYNLNGDSIMSIGQRGQGPSDFTSNGVNGQNFFEDKNNYGTWIIDVNSAKLKRLNLGKSLINGSAEVDSVIPMQMMVTKAYIVGDSLIQLPMGEGTFDLALSALDGTLLHREPLYRLPVDDIFTVYHSPARVSPDGRFLVIAMSAINQLNILDLQNPTVRESTSIGGVKNHDDILDQETHLPNRVYYFDLTLNDNNIFALYQNRPYISKDESDWDNGEIHIFDYEGSLIYRIPLDERLRSISYSEIDNSLYGLDLNDTVWKYDLSELNL